MKVIVFGANGMAGHMIALYLSEQGHEVTGFVRKKNGLFPCIEGDATDVQSVHQIIRDLAPDILINCIGILNTAVDARPAEGIYINSVFPHLLADYTEDTQTKVIHISSDCVFSGDIGHYTEDSYPDARSYYGRSKALGELFDDRSLTFRTSIVGPELKKDGIGLFHWFMHQTGAVDGFTNVIWSGVSTLELAKAIDCAMAQDLTGLYHLVNNETISKYDLLRLFNRYMNEDRTVIHKNAHFISDRSLLDTRSELHHKVPSYEQMIQELSEWIRQHAEIYTQYISTYSGTGGTR